MKVHAEHAQAALGSGDRGPMNGPRGAGAQLVRQLLVADLVFVLPRLKLLEECHRARKMCRFGTVVNPLSPLPPFQNGCGGLLSLARG